MNGIQRVSQIIKHQQVDRIPIYGWVKANLNEPIVAALGSIQAFEDRYEFDLSHIFGGPQPYDGNIINEARQLKRGVLEPADLLEIPMGNAAAESAYDDIKRELAYYRGDRQRFCYVQTPGIFEANNGYFGIENHLAYMLLYPDELSQVYARQAKWNKQFADVCIDLGVDMIHISDDWGSQNALLFSPELWHSMVAPNIKSTADLVRKRGCFLSLHSDGNINSVLSGVRDLGFDVVHPFQESAGMDYNTYLSQYRNAFTVMGGLDVQTTVGFGKIEFAKKEIERIIATFGQRGLILCTTHYIQNHCSMEELFEVFDFAYKLIRR